MQTINSYESAYQELLAISGEIENEAVSMDDLADKVQRASLLIEYCQTKLRSTEEAVNKIIGQLDKE